MKRLVVFYSYSNNTREVVSKINEKYHYDTLEIKPIEEYSRDYQTVVDSEEKLVPLDYQPDIEDINIDLKEYDSIILCTPVWWYSVASPVNTFLHKYNLKGKELIVIATNGGWLGRTFENIETITNTKISKSISIKYDEDRLVSTYELEEFIDNLEN